jgi:hypothetical protein
MLDLDVSMPNPTLGREASTPNFKLALDMSMSKPYVGSGRDRDHLHVGHARIWALPHVGSRHVPVQCHVGPRHVHTQPYVDSGLDRVHLKFWWRCLGRRWSLQVLVGLPYALAEPAPHVRTPSTRVDLPLRWVRPDCHMARGCLTLP